MKNFPTTVSPPREWLTQRKWLNMKKKYGQRVSWHSHTQSLEVWIGEKVRHIRRIRTKGVSRINTLRPRQNDRHFPDDIFKRIFMNENTWISNKNSLKFDPKGPINNITAFVRIMVWHRPGDKPLFEQMMVRLPTHMCVTPAQWVKENKTHPGVKGHTNWDVLTPTRQYEKLQIRIWNILHWTFSAAYQNVRHITGSSLNI